MPSKPIKQGFKVRAIYDGGYLYNFIFCSRFWKIVELIDYDLLTSHQNVVFTLAQSLPPPPTGHTYTIYLDNLFTNTVLFRELKGLKIDACGTTRASASKDFPSILYQMKDKHG